MKIYTDQAIRQLQNLRQGGPANAAGQAAGTGKADRVDFSKELQKLRNVKEGSFVDTERQAKLEEVKSQIAEGTYRPEAIKVAESLLRYIVEGK